MNKENLIIRITQELSGQWTMPILLELEACGGRFTPLQKRLETAPSRLSDNLNKMIHSGLIVHLSPYERRHPLLAEYVLTEKGHLYREAANLVQHAETEIGKGRLSSKAWNIPVLLALDFDNHRFQEIRNALQQITPRMLTIRLEELNNDGLINKLVSEKPRLSFLYRLSDHIYQPVHNLSTDLSTLV